MDKKENVLVVALEERVILVSAEITDELADRFCKELDRFAAKGTDSVRCYIRSHGGALGAALYMMQSVDRAPFPVDFVALERVASAGLLLMQCGRNAYSAGRTEFDFHRTHQNYRLLEAKTRDVTIGWNEVVDDVWNIAVCDAVMLQRLLRRADPRAILPLFHHEMAINAHRAKLIGLISGYLHPALVRADKKAIRCAMRDSLRKKAAGVARSTQRKERSPK
ncbi:MAG: ATP-dependent Clp protease proteolytic subunit [Candidatus Yanofskybacteria bacterium]|nr:ATP-dependent Clp protease proteolytic subunit [Candidatus Yanofskybacteria bacterium]